jgi:hypothetical protein
MKIHLTQPWKMLVVAAPILVLSGPAFASIKDVIFRQRPEIGFPPLINPYEPDKLHVVEPAEDKTEKTVPQGKDPPAGATVTPGESGGVIPPPATGDEGIQTEVPDPGAGTDKDVIVPPAAQQSR